MTQTIAVDVPLGPQRTGLAIGCIVYQLDGSTVFSTFDVTGWYEAPAGSGKWHHPGVVGPDVGGMIAVGVLGTEYDRQAFEASGVVISIATLEAIADMVLKRGAANVDGDAERGSLYELIQINTKANMDDDTLTLTIYQTDGTTIFGTRTLTFNSSGKPVASVA